MKKKYETLDEYLDDLDAIKEQIAEETSDMTPKQVRAYFNGAVRRLEQKTGQKLRPRRPSRKVSTAKRLSQAPAGVMPALKAWRELT